MSLPPGIKALFSDHAQCLAHSEKMRDRWCATEPQVVGPVFGAIGPIPIPGAQISSGVSLSCAVTSPHERQAGGHHHALLAGSDGHIDTPCIHLEALTSHRCDAVDHEQGRVACSVDCCTDRRNVVSDRRGGVDVHREDGSDVVSGVGSQVRLNRCRVDRGSPLGGDGVHPQTVELGHLAPQPCESAAVEYQNPVAARQRVRDGHFPARVPVADRYKRPARRARDCGKGIEDLVDDLGEIAGVDIGHRAVHGAEHSLRDDARSRNSNDLRPGCERHFHDVGVCHGITATPRR